MKKRIVMFSCGDCVINTRSIKYKNYEETSVSTWFNVMKHKNSQIAYLNFVIRNMIRNFAGMEAAALMTLQ